MNKQELIEKYKELANSSFDIAAVVACQLVLKDLEQLDEPEKATIPQFVANYIEQTKNEDYHLLGAMTEIRSHKNKEIDAWFYTDDNIEVFARAWLDGYEVEKEKRYRISMPKARNYKNHAQILCEKDGKIFWCGEWYPFRTKFTRKELEEAGFSEVFNSPLFEVEEVE